MLGRICSGRISLAVGVLGLVLAVSVGLWLFLAASFEPNGRTNAVFQFLDALVVTPVAEQFRHVVFTKQFVAFMGLIALLAVVVPATRKEPILSKGLFQDVFWFLYQPVVFVVIFATWLTWLPNFFDAHLGNLKTDIVTQWPAWGRLVLGILIADFMHWVQHVMLHKIPILWNFHKVHHSQQQLNVFTNFRVHAVDHVLLMTLRAVPLLILSFEIPEVFIVLVFQKWHPWFTHANVRTNLGPLKYVLVTPQSHRVHHSVEAEHRDKNFGSLLSIWDHLFGTQVRNYDVYPGTGIGDKGYPLEQGVAWWMLPVMPIVQMFQPFREIGRDLLRQRGRKRALQ